MNQNGRKLVLGGLFAALTCMLTMTLQIPSPMSGYVNLGDCAVLLSGWILGPIYGGAAAGIGSMLADIFSGYGYYAPGTLVIKGTMAVVAGLIYRSAAQSGKSAQRINRAVGATAAELVMILGYFAYAGLLLGNGLGAAASIPGNVVQGVFGILSSMVVMELLVKNPALKSATSI